MREWKIIGVSFDQMHMGDLLRQVYEHPNATIAGVWDPDPKRMVGAGKKFAIPDDLLFTDLEECVSRTRPDIAIICSSTAEHATLVERLAPHVQAIIVEKPFATSLSQADIMIAAMKDKMLAVNWPLAWYPCHNTAKRLIDEGRIGPVREVHYYDGNRGPLYHLADKMEREPGPSEKANSWWYTKSAGGGSLLDYLGYGVTLGTWFLDGRSPSEITTIAGGDSSLEVDEHSVTVARYGDDLSKFETRWGTFTDPWTHQPNPRCGFVLVGQHGTIASWDYSDHVIVQTRDRPEPTEVPVDELPKGRRGPVEYVIDCLEAGRRIEGCLDPALSRIGQQIVDTALFSASERKTVDLLR